MKTAARNRGLTTADLPTRLSLLVALLATFFYPVLAGTAQCEDSERSIEYLLPPDTLLYLATEDGMLAEELAKSMPLNEILQEQEVVDFLEKPKEFVNKVLAGLKEKAAQEEALKGIDLNIEKFWNCEVGRSFMAITHITVPGPDTGAFIPDIGFMFGAEFKDPETNIIQFAKNAAVTVASSQGVALMLRQYEYEGVPYERLELPLFLHGLSPLFFRIGEMDVLATSTASMQAMVDLYLGRSEDSLAAQGSFSGSMNYIDFSDPAASKSFVDIQDLMSVAEDLVSKLVDLVPLKMSGSEEEQAEVTTFLEGFPDRLSVVVDMLGLRTMKAAYGTQISRNGIAKSVSYLVLDGPPKGLVALSPDVPITKDKLRLIPQDAVTFSIGQFDLAGLYDLIMESIRVVHEETYGNIQATMQAFFEALAEGEEGETTDVRRDILGALGTEMISYELQSKGGMAMMMGTPPVYILVGIKDYDRFSSAVKRLFDGLASSNPDVGQFLSLKALDFEGQPIQYLQFKGPIPLQPTFAKVGDYLAFGFQLNDVKKLIKDFGKSETSILDNEDFQSFYAKLPKGKDPLSLSYTNVKVKFAATYEQIVPIIPMITMGLPPEIELPFDFMLLPTSESITKHLFSSITAGYKDGEGYKWVSFGPFGPEVGKVVLATALGVGASALYFAEEFEGERSEAIVSIPPDESAAEVDLTLQAKKDLGSLAGACTVYNIEHGRFPELLEDLLVPTEGYPNGFYPPKKLPLDPWGNPYRYRRLDGGTHQYMIWSSGPNGVDDGGEGDDVVKLK